MKADKATLAIRRKLEKLEAEIAAMTPEQRELEKKRAEEWDFKCNGFLDITPEEIERAHKLFMSFAEVIE